MSSLDDHAIGINDFQLSLITNDVQVTTEERYEQNESWAIKNLEEGAFQITSSKGILPEELLQDEEVTLDGFHAELYTAIERFNEEGALGSLFIFVRDDGHLLSSEINYSDFDILDLPEGLEMVVVDGGNSITGESYKVTFFIDQQQVVKVFD